MRTIVPKNAVLVPDNAECVFKGEIYSVYHWQQKMFDGTYESFEMLKRPDTVETIIVEDNKILILIQKQPHLKSFFDIPGGRHDIESENELAAAKRELKEETGLACNNYKLLSVTQSTSQIERFKYTYVAWNIAERDRQTLDSGEKIEMIWKDLSEVKDMIEKGSLPHFPEKLVRGVDGADELIKLPEYSTL